MNPLVLSNPVSSSPRRAWLWMLILLLCASGLRITAISAKSVWFDELFMRYLIRYSTFPELITGKTGDLLPPLYYLLGKGWLDAVGDSELSMRMFSALPSLLAVAMVTAATRRLFNRRASLWALAFVALAPVQVYYAQEARFYALTVMWSACLLWGLSAVWRGKRYGLALYLLGAIGGLYTHYFFGILLAVVHLLIGVYWLSGARPRSLIRPPWSWLIGADLALLVLYLPQLARFLSASKAVLGSFWIIRPSPAAPITTMTFMLFGVTLPGFLLIAAIVTTVCALVIGGIDISRYSKTLRGTWWALVATVLGVLVIGLIVSWTASSIYLDRSFLLLSPWLIVALGGSMAARRGTPLPFIGYCLLGLMIIGSVLTLTQADPAKPPFRQIAADLVANPLTADAPVFALHDAVPLSLRYYQPRLTTIMQVVNLGQQSWLYPQIAIYPDTWERFRIQRIPREQMAQDLRARSGVFRVVITANIEPPEQALLLALRERPCRQTLQDYPPFVSVLTMDCP